MPITVSIINPSDRAALTCKWRDPVTQRWRYRSTGTTIRREAERFRALLEIQLNDTSYREPVNVTWAEFRRRYETEVGPTKAAKTIAKTKSVFNIVEQLIGPKYLAAMNAAVISQYAAKLRATGVAAWTVRGHLSELRKTLRWAFRMGLLASVPAIELPRALNKAKARPITLEEFERFIANIPKKVPQPELVADWEYLSWGLWLSGLRLREAMCVHWTDPNMIQVDFSASRPILRIPAALQKSRRKELCPITPDFAEHLERTPPDQRRGWVFNPWTFPRGRTEGIHRPTAEHVGKVLAAIGKEAGIKVAEGKCVSAHEFRRSFATRWALKVPAIILRDLMRHSSVKITEDFYEEVLAQDAAEHIWRPRGHSFGHSDPDHDFTDAANSENNAGNQGEFEMHPEGLEPPTLGSEDQ